MSRTATAIIPEQAKRPIFALTAAVIEGRAVRIGASHASRFMRDVSNTACNTSNGENSR